MDTEVKGGTGIRCHENGCKRKADFHVQQWGWNRSREYCRYHASTYWNWKAVNIWPVANSDNGDNGDSSISDKIEGEVTDEGQ